MSTTAPIDEKERVQQWRFEEFVRMGFSRPAARRLADTPDADLHRAAGLLRQGCSLVTAYRILRG